MSAHGTGWACDKVIEECTERRSRGRGGREGECSKRDHWGELEWLGCEVTGAHSPAPRGRLKLSSWLQT